MSVYPQHDVTP